MSIMYVHKFGEYEFPYHHLPWADRDGAMAFGRLWFVGYEYLLYLHEVVNTILALSPQKVLDFGCGDGRLSYELAKRGIPDIVGIDISERAIAFAKAFNWENQARFYCIDIRQLDEEGFDVVVAIEVLEHISDEQIDGVLAAIRQRLRQRGYFIVTVPTTVFPLIPKKHYRHYDYNLLQRQVSNYFDIASIKYIFKVGWMERLLRRLVMNRFFIANSKPWIKLISKLYRRYITLATEKDGGHMLVVMRPR